MLLVDTNVWLSAADEESDRHADSVAVIAENEGELAATVPVIAETSWPIVDRLGPDAQVGFLGLIPAGEIDRIDLTGADWERVVTLCRQYADQPRPHRLPGGAGPASSYNRAHVTSSTRPGAETQ